MTEFRWITTNRDSVCAGCHCVLHKGDRVLWSLTERNRIWCKGCGRSSGVNDDEEGKGTVGDGKSFPSMTTTTESSYEAIKTTYGNEEILYKRAYMDDFVILFVRRRDG